MCKKLMSKGLHGFHKMIGYCMKDATKDYLKMIYHNVNAIGISLSLEQYALHG